MHFIHLRFNFRFKILSTIHLLLYYLWVTTHLNILIIFQITFLITCELVPRGHKPLFVPSFPSGTFVKSAEGKFFSNFVWCKIGYPRVTQGIPGHSRVVYQGIPKYHRVYQGMTTQKWLYYQMWSETESTFSLV